MSSVNDTPRGHNCVLAPLPSATIDRIADEALRRSGRPAWSDPLVIGMELGFELLPCPPGAAVEVERTSASRLAFGAEALPAAHASRVRLALARGLLLREGLAHGLEDVFALAGAFERRAEVVDV